MSKRAPLASRFALAVGYVTLALTTSAFADDAVCTPNSAARAKQLTKARIREFKTLLFADIAKSEFPSVTFKWPDGIRLAFTGLDQLTKSDFQEIQIARVMFQSALGPASKFLAFDEVKGNPYDDRRDVNFIVYFYDGTALRPSDEGNIKLYLAQVLTSQAYADAAWQAYKNAGFGTFMQVLPNPQGKFLRGFAAIDLSLARTIGLSKVLDSLLRESLSLTVLEIEEVARSWVGPDGLILSERAEAFSDYIAFVYCTGTPFGTTKNQFESQIDKLPD